MFYRRFSGLLLVGTTIAICHAGEPSATSMPRDESLVLPAFQHFVESNCFDCHDSATKTADLALDEILVQDVTKNQETWERVVRKLSTRQMPPIEMPRPSEADYEAALASLESSLDAVAAAPPNPGRSETFRRLTRTEYQNCIRDLLNLNVDVDALLPADESSLGFDNITVADLSPTLLNRYLSAAQTISRLAVGRAPREPREDNFRIRPDVTQDTHVEGLPIGTRGGTLIHYNFPRDGEYEIQVRLMRDRNDEIESLTSSDELEIMVDRGARALFTVQPPQKGESHQTLDAKLKTRITTTAGPHDVGVAFLAETASLQETTRQPLNVHFNFYRHPRLGPAVYQVSILGPFETGGPGESPSRKRLFINAPGDSEPQEGYAKQILSQVSRQAFRRPVDEEDLKTPLEFFRWKRGRRIRRWNRGRPHLDSGEPTFFISHRA